MVKLILLNEVNFVPACCSIKIWRHPPSRRLRRPVHHEMRLQNQESACARQKKSSHPIYTALLPQIFHSPTKSTCLVCLKKSKGFRALIIDSLKSLTAVTESRHFSYTKHSFASVKPSDRWSWSTLILFLTIERCEDYPRLYAHSIALMPLTLDLD